MSEEQKETSNVVQELVWALVDEQATEEQLKQLEALITSDTEAREAYVKCMQLHADLHLMYAEEKAPPKVTPSAPPLPPPMVTELPVSDEGQLN